MGESPKIAEPLELQGRNHVQAKESLNLGVRMKDEICLVLTVFVVLRHLNQLEKRRGRGDRGGSDAPPRSPRPLRRKKLPHTTKSVRIRTMYVRMKYVRMKYEG